jgi:WD40 repeat protein
VSPDGRLALSASTDGTARLWDLADGRELRSFLGFFQDFRAASFSSDGQFALLVSGSPVEYVLIWDVQAGRVVRYLGGRRDSRIISATVSAEGRSILTIDRTQRARLWHIGGGQERCRFEGDFSEILAAMIQGPIVLTAHRDGSVVTWLIPYADLEAGR